MSDPKPGVLSLSPNHAKVLVSILMKVSVKGTLNIHKSRLVQLLGTQLEDFEKLRVELLKEYCDKDEAGEPKVEKEQYCLTTGMPKFIEEFVKLNNTFRIEVGTEDPVKEKAVQIGGELLLGDQCPELTQEESLYLVSLVDAFEAAKVKKAD